MVRNIIYIKFDQDGDPLSVAPTRMVKNGSYIIGYNSPTNEAMLIEDGYTRYEGTTPWSRLVLKDGVVTERVQEPVQKPVSRIYTKLQIRRAMRALGIESQLDEILANNQTFQKDWTDAQEINLDDEMFRQANISQQLISMIIDAINGKFPEQPPQEQQQEEQEPQQEQPADEQPADEQQEQSQEPVAE